MKRSERAQIVSKILNKAYPKTPVPLDHSDAYTLLIAVLLSAQCTDERVNTVTPILFKKASDPESMSKLTEKQIYKIIKPCGLGPKKSKAIKKLSKILVTEYDSKVPEDIQKLEKLPGVGHKTASVVISQGFGIPAFPVDTHIHRLAQRWGLTNGKNVVKTEEDLKKYFQKKTGISFIYKLSFGVENFAKLEHVMALNAKYVLNVFPKERNLLCTNALR